MTWSQTDIGSSVGPQRRLQDAGAVDDDRDWANLGFDMCRDGLEPGLVADIPEQGMAIDLYRDRLGPLHVAIEHDDLVAAPRQVAAAGRADAARFRR